MSTSNNYSQDVVTQVVTKIPIATLVEVAALHLGFDLENHRHYRIEHSGKVDTLPANAVLHVFSETREKLA